MDESINKTLAAIRALPEGTFLYADKRTVTEGEFLALKSADLVALADEYESMRLMLEAADEDSELWFGEKSILKFADGKWRTNNASTIDSRSIRTYQQEGWDSPLGAFKALQPNPAPDGGRK